MATAMRPYDIWLTEKLTALSPEFDTDVFVSYIISILETDTPVEEKTESIEGILMQALEEDKSQAACREILQQWASFGGEGSAKNEAEGNKKDAGDILSEIMGQQTLATTADKQLTTEQQAYKEAILAQYAQISDGEEEEDEAVTVSGVAGGKNSSQCSKAAPSNSVQLERNLNAVLVAQTEKDQREQSKQEHERKKEKDKQDREAQRQQQQNRKEAEKKRTQKGERRR